MVCITGGLTIHITHIPPSPLIFPHFVDRLLIMSSNFVGCFGTNDSKATNVVIDSFTTYLVPKVPTNAMMFTGKPWSLNSTIPWKNSQ